MFQKVKYSSLNELVYNEIKDKIINNELKPNEKLDVDYLSTSLGVSRTPVTNALKSLNKDGYVIIHARSGSYVRELSKEELYSIFNFREALESQVIREVIALTNVDILDRFEYEFQRLSYIEFNDNLEIKKRLVNDFFETEMKFHSYLIDLCPKIIGDEIKNLIDLTKRIRILHIIYKINNTELYNFQDEIQIHCDLIQAIKSRSLEKSVEFMIQDIRSTKEDIMNCFGKIN